MLVPRCHPEEGRGTSSNFLPSKLRNKRMPGAFGMVMAKSIHPSLLKSRLVMEVAPAAESGHGVVDVHFPSRGFVNTTGGADSRVATISTARSLFTSLAMAAVPACSNVNAASAVRLAKVLLPLLRHIAAPLAVVA